MSISEASIITQSEETDTKTDGVTSKNLSVDNHIARGTKRLGENSEAGPSSANKHPRISDNIVGANNATSAASDVRSTEAGLSSYNNYGESKPADTMIAGSSNKHPQNLEQRRKRPKQQTMFIPKKRT